MYDRVFFPILIIFFFFSIIISIAAFKSPSTINVARFGAEADGSTDASKAFLAAWAAACKSSGTSKILVPTGKYLISSAIVFQGQSCMARAIVIQIDGILLAPESYRQIASKSAWIMFQNTNGVSIIGGVLNAKGSGLWACKNSGGGCPQGATSLHFSHSNNVLISGLTSLNSQMFHIVINNCENVKLQSMKILANGNSPNTDGIHISESTHVTVRNSKVGTGDDCISIGAGSTNLWIENISCGPGHGISIGSLGKEFNEAGVQNVTVTTSKLVGTQNGVRIKSWPKTSKGFVKDVLFQHITMLNVQNPLIIDQHYCNGKHTCPKSGPGIKISDVTYKDIHGTSASKVPINFDCSKEKPCSGITVKGVDVKYAGSMKTASAVCSNVVFASDMVSPDSCI